MKIIKGLFYSDDHEWVRVEDDIAYIGITDYAQHNMGDIVYVELPEEDTEIERGDAFGVVESVKAASDMYSPVSGTVVKFNEDLEDEPELVNEDAFENWMIAVRMSDESELEDLMDAAAYEEFCEGEE